jgi:hypothetical protein
MSTSQVDGSVFNASNVDLNTADPRDVICALAFSGNEYNGNLGARISAIVSQNCYVLNQTECCGDCNVPD